MKKNKNSKKYAKMFLNAVGIEKAAGALKELKAAEDLMVKSVDFRSLLVSPMFSDEERLAAIREVGSMLGISGQTVKFLNFLAERSAAGALSDVVAYAVAIYSDRMARVKATVFTPVAIGTDYESRLRESLKKITDREVDIEYSVDPSLLGGMLVKVGSTMYDGTVKGQLRLLRDELIRG